MGASPRWAEAGRGGFGADARERVYRREQPFLCGIGDKNGAAARAHPDTFDAGDRVEFFGDRFSEASGEAVR